MEWFAIRRENHYAAALWPKKTSFRGGLALMTRLEKAGKAGGFSEGP